jgi:hypothetical protein
VSTVLPFFVACFLIVAIVVAITKQVGGVVGDGPDTTGSDGGGGDGGE